MVTAYLVPGAPLIHFAAETIGILLALRYYYRLREVRADPVSDDHRLTLLIAATFGALLGSRLLGGFESPEVFLSGGGEAGWLYYVRAKTIVGGLLGGLWSVELTKWAINVTRRTGDVYVYPLLLAMIIGRLGCLAMGVGEPTFGLPTELWVGIDLGDGVRRHATALYEIIFLSLLWWALRWLDRRRSLRPGQLFAALMVSYLSYRFVIGFIQPRELVGYLGAIQWACLLGLVWYTYDHLFALTRVRGKGAR